MKFFIKKTILNFILFVFLIACNNTEKSKPNSLLQEQKKPGSTYQDTLIVRENAAVFFQPDSLQLLKIKAANTPHVFNSMVHELFYQMRNARNVISTNYSNIIKIETNNCRYILFIKSNGEKHIVDLNNFNDMSGIILFKTTAKPLLIDMMNVDSELGFYFKNK